MSTRLRGTRGQAGDGKLSMVLALVVIAGLIYLLKLTVPPRIDKADFADFVEDKTREFVVQQITYDQLVVAILQEADKLGLPIREDNLRITDSETRVQVRVHYELTQTVIGGKKWTQSYDVDVEVPRI